VKNNFLASLDVKVDTVGANGLGEREKWDRDFAFRQWSKCISCAGAGLHEKKKLLHLL
jgi:hypothetical protein